VATQDACRGYQPWLTLLKIAVGRLPVYDYHDHRNTAVAPWRGKKGDNMRTPVTKKTAAVVVCFLGACLAVLATADQKPRLCGHWNFNPAVSDDAAGRISAAQQGPSEKTIGSYSASPGPYPGTYPGVGVERPIGGNGGVRVGDPDGTTRGDPGDPTSGVSGGVNLPVNYPPGNSGDPGAPGRRGGPAEQSGPAGASTAWDWLARNPKFLQIDQQGKQIVITDDAGHARTYFPDGKKHESADAKGNKTSTKARWEGNSLVAETRIGNSGVLTETFRPSEDGNQIYVKTLFESPSLRSPFNIRRVYDLAKSPASS